MIFISGTGGMDGEFYNEQAATLIIYPSYESYVHDSTYTRTS